MSNLTEGWTVRERRDSDGGLIDCFVEAPKENGMAYGLEVLGDDYEGYGGVERKLEHCQLIVRLINSADAPIPEEVKPKNALQKLNDRSYQQLKFYRSVVRQSKEAAKPEITAVQKTMKLAQSRLSNYKGTNNEPDDIKRKALADYGRILFEAGQKYVVEELGNAIRESWENMEPEYKAAHAAAAEAVIKAAIPEGLHHELAGVITDYENGKTFDEVSLQTIKRVRDALLAIYDAVPPLPR